MAENESLDSSIARRWISVAEGVRSGCDLDELTRRVLDRFYKTLRNIRKDIPFAEMIAAAEDYPKLMRICEQIDGASDVKQCLLRAALENEGIVNILEQFLNDALESCLYDIPHLAAEIDMNVNLSDSRRKMDAVRISLATDLHRIAEKLSVKPSGQLQKPRGASEKSQTDITQDMLSESLIKGFRR
jgi:hypothetical protein